MGVGHRDRLGDCHQPFPADHRADRNGRESWSSKKSTPFGLGTLRDDNATFGFLLMGTIIVIGALLFFSVAALGPISEHFGPMPFGG